MITRLLFRLEDTRLMWGARRAVWRCRAEHYGHVGRRWRNLWAHRLYSRLLLARLFCVCLFSGVPGAVLVLLVLWWLAWGLLTAR